MKNMGKRIVCLLVCVTVIISVNIQILASGITKSITVSFNSVDIKVCGRNTTADNFLYDGRTYVQLRNICEILQKDIVWDSDSNTANINDKSEEEESNSQILENFIDMSDNNKRDSRTQKINVGVNTVNIKVNGKNVFADNYVFNGRTYIQLRSVSELLNKEITWDKETKTVYIDNKKEKENKISGDPEKLYETIGTLKAQVIQRLIRIADVDEIEINTGNFDNGSISFFVANDKGASMFKINFNEVYAVSLSLSILNYFDIDLLSIMSEAFILTKNKQIVQEGMNTAVDAALKKLEENESAILDAKSKKQKLNVVENSETIKGSKPATRISYSVDLVDSGGLFMKFTVKEDYDETKKIRENLVKGNLDEFYTQLSEGDAAVAKYMQKVSDVDLIFLGKDSENRPSLAFEFRDDDNNNIASGVQLTFIKDDNFMVAIKGVNCIYTEETRKIFNRALSLLKDDDDDSYNQGLDSSINNIVKITEKMVDDDEIRKIMDEGGTKTVLEESKIITGKTNVTKIEYSIWVDEGNLNSMMQVKKVTMTETQEES